MLHTVHLEYILHKLLAAVPDVTDINITVGHPFQVESYGVLKPIFFHPEIQKLTPYQTEAIAVCLLRNDKRNINMLLKNGSCDLSFSLEGRARFRANIFSQQGRYSIVMRKIENEIKTLSELNMPPIINALAKERNGIILVTGATGSGKTTTIAAILEEINLTQPVHVVTLEDPVEFIFYPKKATFNQRELGIDFPDFSNGIRAALRQSPRVIMVGEMRDRETVEIAISAAETGHLVFSTLHTVDAASTINRIVGLFDFDEEKQIRMRLSESLRWVISQRLLPDISKQKRIAAIEVMGMSLLIKDIIANGESQDKTIYHSMESMRPLGYQTFDQHILDLFREKKISEEVAKVFASKKSIVSRGIDSIKMRSGTAVNEIENLSLELPADDSSGEDGK